MPKTETRVVATNSNAADNADMDEEYEEYDEEEEDDFDPDEIANYSGIDPVSSVRPVLRQGVEFPGEVKSAEFGKAKSTGRKQFALQYRFTDASVGESTTVYEYLGDDEAGRPYLVARLQQLDIDPNGKTKRQIAEEMETKYVKAILGIQKKTKQYPAKNTIRVVTASSDVPFDDDDSDDDF